MCLKLILTNKSSVKLTSDSYLVILSRLPQILDQVISELAESNFKQNLLTHSNSLVISIVKPLVSRNFCKNV